MCVRGVDMNVVPSEAVTCATIGGGPETRHDCTGSRYIQFSLLEGEGMDVYDGV